MVVATAALAAIHRCVQYLSETLDVYTITFFRNLFGLLAVLPLVIRNGTNSLRTNKFGLHVLRSCTGIFAILLWFTALVHCSGSLLWQK